MDKVNKVPGDIQLDNINKLRDVFPEFVKDGIIDFDALKVFFEKEGKLPENQEKYGLSWAGKSNAFNLIKTPATGTLVPDEKESVDFDGTENLFIEGDNLEVLKLLQKHYREQIKMIYIDPPYNTGKDFIYKDNFTEDKSDYYERTGQNAGGIPMTTNRDSSGRYHSDWLTMMYPRLFLARNLLREDGVIFISIDDNEVANLRLIMDEIFGDENFINLVSIQTKPNAGASGGGEDIRLKKNIEYLMIYCKTRDSFEQFNEVSDEEDLFDYISEYEELGKSWKYTRVMYSLGDKNFYKDIKDSNGGDIKIFKHSNVLIKTVSELAKQENLSEEAIYIKYFDKIFRDTNAQSSIREKVLKATDNEDSFYSIEYIPRSGKNKGKSIPLYYKGRNKDLIAWLRDTAEKNGDSIIKKNKIGTLWHFDWNNISKEGDMQFSNGKKPIELIKKCMNLTTSTLENEIILDFLPDLEQLLMRLWI